MEPTYSKKFKPINKSEAKEAIWRTIRHDHENNPLDIEKNKNSLTIEEYKNLPIKKAF
jgi:hypothetical protein